MKGKIPTLNTLPIRMPRQKGNGGLGGAGGRKWNRQNERARRDDDA